MADTDIDFDLMIKGGRAGSQFQSGRRYFPREGYLVIELFVVKSGAVEIRIRLTDLLVR